MRAIKGFVSLLLAILLLTSVTAFAAGAPAFRPEEFLVILTCRKGMEARIAAGRSSRKVR